MAVSLSDIRHTSSRSQLHLASEDYFAETGLRGTGELLEQRGHRRHRRWWFVIGILVVFMLGTTARLFIWPDLPALPPHVDAVISLGGVGDRVSPARALGRAHRTSFLVESTLGAEARTDRCLPPTPGVMVFCFQADPLTTRGEARYIAQLAAQYHWISIALVTTPDQAWRARLRVTRCFAGHVYVVRAHLPTIDWLYQIPYQWLATAKALISERSC